MSGIRARDPRSVRLSRRRFSRNDDRVDRDAAFSTLHAALAALSRIVAPILPFLADSMYGNLVAAFDPAAPDSVHLTRWPSTELAGFADGMHARSAEEFERVVDVVRARVAGGRRDHEATATGRITPIGSLSIASARR